MSCKAVDIGFLEEKEGWLLHPKFFPSKVGGKPAWLDLKNLPSRDELTCKKCNDPLLFLCQVYAPFEDKIECFHRTIFIFICKNGSCCQSNCADNFIVLRCQLERKNDFYSYEPYEENKNEEFLMDNFPKLCHLCGTKAPSHCSKCKQTYYCSRKHQIVDWQNGHKEICLNLQLGKATLNCCNFLVTETGKSILFKEWELLVDEEDEEEANNVDENKEMEKLTKFLQEKKGGTLNNIDDNELEQYTRTLPTDKVFNKFSKRILRHPDQVLRYQKGGTPLWITGNYNELLQVPKCKYCNGERQFEFQIMPQLLNFINVGLEVNSIDWGILAVYTCTNSCNSGPAYKEEHLIKQDLN